MTSGDEASLEFPRGLEWTQALGLTPDEARVLNPCVPGEFTQPATYYLNSGSPRLVYLGTAEGTLPLVRGRWYLIPDNVLARHWELRREAAPVARAARFAR